VADGAFGDVGHRQVRHHPHPDEVVEVDRTRQDLDRVHDVVLADHHALGRPGRTRRVDQRRDVVGVGRCGERIEVGGIAGEQVGSLVHAVGQRALRWLDHVDPLERRQLAAHLQDAVEEAGVLDDGHARFGVTGEVLDLFRRRRVVDADRRRPEELGSGIEPVEVGSVAHHQQDPLTSADSGTGQPGGRLGDLLGELLQRPDVPSAAVAHRVQRRRGGVGTHQIEEVTWHRAARGGSVDLGDG
jgi:hypothetical protein